MNNFTDKEKIENFDLIYQSVFVDKKFDSFNKSDMQVLLFKFYIENLEKTHNLSNISNYYISNELGITQQKARQLRIKKQIIYGKKYNIGEELSKLADYAIYSKTDELVQLHMNDPNLLIEIENYLEANHQFTIKSLNSQLLQIKIQYFIGLLLNFEVKENKNQILNILKNSYSNEKNTKKIFNDTNIGRSLIEYGANIATIASSICGLKLKDSVLSPFMLAFKKKYDL